MSEYYITKLSGGNEHTFTIRTVDLDPDDSLSSTRIIRPGKNSHIIPRILDGDKILLGKEEILDLPLAQGYDALYILGDAETSQGGKGVAAEEPVHHRGCIEDQVEGNCYVV